MSEVKWIKLQTDIFDNRKIKQIYRDMEAKKRALGLRAPTLKKGPVFYMVVLIGKLTYVGRTSMEVRVDAYVEDSTGMRKTINRAYIVMVAINEEGSPIPVPGLIVSTENEKYEWECGEKRYQLRKTRRLEGY